MATGALIGYGSTIQVESADSPGVWTSIAEVKSITPPSDTIDVLDATNMDSPNATREFILGLNDPGECSFEMNFIPGSNADDTIQAIRAARVARNIRIAWANGIYWTFTGILTAYEPDAPFDDVMTATVTFKVTGSYVTT